MSVFVAIFCIGIIADTEIAEIKNTLAETVRPLEGKIALEARINAMFDSVKETTLFGKTTTTIKFDGTAEQAMTVLNAAKDRDTAKKAKDKAIADKETAIKERDKANTAKKLAESQKVTAETNAANKAVAAEQQLKVANALKSEATEKMNRSNTLFSQQLNLNTLYQQAISDRDSYKAKAEQANGLITQITELKQDLRNAYTSVGAMAKANGSLLYDPALKLNNPTPEQERLLQATRNYAAAHSNNAGFNDIAQDIEKHYGFTTGIQNHIDSLTPKPPTRNISYEHGL